MVKQLRINEGERHTIKWAIFITFPNDHSFLLNYKTSLSLPEVKRFVKVKFIAVTWKFVLGSRGNKWRTPGSLAFLLTLYYTTTSTIWSVSQLTQESPCHSGIQVVGPYLVDTKVRERDWIYWIDWILIKFFGEATQLCLSELDISVWLFTRIQGSYMLYVWNVCTKPDRLQQTLTGINSAIPNASHVRMSQWCSLSETLGWWSAYVKWLVYGLVLPGSHTF